MTGTGVRRPLTAALIALVVVAGLVVAVLNISRLPLLGDGPEYSAEFSDAAGLQSGEEVRIAGVKVGKVKDVVVAHARVVVDFTVKGQSLGRTTSASIQIRTLLGQHYLALDPAGPGELEAGARIPLSRTQVPLNVVPAFQQLTRTVGEIDTASLAKAFDTLSDALSNTAPNVRGALRGLSRLSDTIASRDTAIRQLISRARGVADTVAAQTPALSELIDDTNTVLAVVRKRRETIDQILQGTISLANQLRGLVKDNAKTLKPAMDQLGTVLDVLRRNDRALDQLLTTLPTYVRVFNNQVGSGQFLEANILFPTDLSVCSTSSANSLVGLLNPVLSQVDKSAGGTGKPCLPLSSLGGNVP